MHGGVCVSLFPIAAPGKRGVPAMLSLGPGAMEKASCYAEPTPDAEPSKHGLCLRWLQEGKGAPQRWLNGSCNWIRGVEKWALRGKKALPTPTIPQEWWQGWTQEKKAMPDHHKQPALFLIWCHCRYLYPVWAEHHSFERDAALVFLVYLGLFRWLYLNIKMSSLTAASTVWSSKGKFKSNAFLWTAPVLNPFFNSFCILWGIKCPFSKAAVRCRHLNTPRETHQCQQALPPSQSLTWAKLTVKQRASPEPSLITWNQAGGEDTKKCDHSGIVERKIP